VSFADGVRFADGVSFADGVNSIEMTLGIHRLITPFRPPASYMIDHVT
jgi:hypothetical protein